ncbi:MAG: amidohydrolase [Proteobacteria bacterium]|nr:amidohydrolase [Pseudomonadota bacterium]
MLITVLRLIVIILVATFAGCGSPRESTQPARVVADTIYYGGDIVTVNDREPTAEALAVKDGKILALGTRAALEAAHKGASTTLTDLKGHALLPGFVDPHSHYIQSLAVANQANVYAPPSGPAHDVESLIAAMKAFREAHQVPKGELIQAYGYDDTVMPGGRLLNRDDLDRAFPDNPVMVGHVSMHGVVMNSAALKQYGISASTKTPPGGVIVRKPGTSEPYGLIMETAYLPVFAALPKPTAEQEVAFSRAGQLLYAEAGITTAQEGATHAGDIEVMQRAAAAQPNLIDVVAYPFITDLDPILKLAPVDTWGKYDRGLKIGGVKITSDGSPQGRTAYFTTPYLAGGPSGEKNWRGEPTFPKADLEAAVRRVHDMKVPLNVHANGDAAIDMTLDAVEKAAGGPAGPDWKVTIIHAQFVRRDQLERMKKLGVTPSLYTLHTYYFAEAHLKNRGPDQTMYISPMRDAIDLGLRPTNHTDFVVAPLDQMMVMWSAVNRISRGGAVIGPGQRITPLEALKAQTIDPAYQYGEQDSKGTLEPGKRADLVILDRNPLKVDPLEIKDIRVLETIKDGTPIYTR